MVATAVAPEFHREEILVGQAAVRLFPLTGSGPGAALPADTVELNAAWPAGWVPIGATEEGVTLGFSRTTEAIRIEEQSVPVAERTTETTFTVGATLMQSSLETMRVAFGGGQIDVTPATLSAKGRRKLTISPELEQFALGLEGKNPDGEPRRILIPIVQSVADAEVQFRRGAAAQKYAVSFRSLVDIQQCEIVDLTPKLPA